MSKKSPFEIFDVLNQTKDEKALKGLSYDPYFVNRGVGQFRDTILLANTMNKMSGVLTPQQQADCMMVSISRRKRFKQGGCAKKKDNKETLELLAKHYQCSFEKAREYQNILNDSQIVDIKKRHETGGMKGKGYEKKKK